MMDGVKENIMSLYKSDPPKPMRVNNVHRVRKESRKLDEIIIKDLRNLFRVKK